MSNLPRFLCKVKETLQDASGVTVHTDIDDLVPEYRPGDLLELRKPDGSIAQLESGLVSYFPDPEVVFSESGFHPPVAFFFRGLKKADIPPGTEIWQIVEHQIPKDVKHRKFERIEKTQGA
ncbi:MAG TPA: hypothetical protein V6D08_12095 [Candidatus Obscuribacterales bacterium]